MFQPGDSFDRYRIEGMLGEGGMGLVYSAYDTRLRRRIALKILRPEVARDEAGLLSEASHRLMREGRAAASLNHPNAIGIFDVGEIEGTPYIAMELARGVPMHRFVGDLRVPMKRRIGWLAQVARGLGAAHRCGLVHRDVKPENVMICDDGSVKILDFGVVKQVSDPMNQPVHPPGAPEFRTMEGVVVGTPLYMAPEQVIGDTVDGRSDQFAWATMAYEILSGGTHPASTNNPRNLAVAYAVLQEKPTPLVEIARDVPAAVDAVVMRALAKSPEERYPSMEDVAAALDAVVAEMPEPEARRSSDSSPTIQLHPRASLPPRAEEHVTLPIVRAAVRPRRSAVARFFLFLPIPLVLALVAFLAGRYFFLLP